MNPKFTIHGTSQEYFIKNGHFIIAQYSCKDGGMRYNMACELVRLANAMYEAIRMTDDNKA